MMECNLKKDVIIYNAAALCEQSLRVKIETKVWAVVFITGSRLW